MEVKMKTLFLVIILFLFETIYSYSQSIQNVIFNEKENKIIINYDLIDSDNSHLYEITLEISNDGGVSFKSLPKSLQGDIGKNIKPGEGKKIIWNVLKDVGELQGDEFVFKVIAKPIEDRSLNSDNFTKSESGGISPYIWIGGGALLLGGAAVLLLSKKNEGGSTIVPDLPDTGNIPWPPK